MKQNSQRRRPDRISANAGGSFAFQAEPGVRPGHALATRSVVRYLLILILLCVAVRAAGPKPVLVVLERNPWLMVMGSDSPILALYDDGGIIYLREKPAPDEPFFRRSVSGAEKTRLELMPYDLAKVADHYELSAATDQITTVIWTPEKKIVVYGSWRKARDFGGDSNPSLKAFVERERKRWESLPTELRQTLLRIDEQRKMSGTPWLPANIEVMFWPYEYAPDESIIWPKDWPGLSAKDTRRRGEDSYSVFLPSAKLPELRRFLETRKEKGAVLIDGKKMADSFRFPFPGEELWMRD